MFFDVEEIVIKVGVIEEVFGDDGCIVLCYSGIELLVWIMIEGFECDIIEFMVVEFVEVIEWFFF